MEISRKVLIVGIGFLIASNIFFAIRRVENKILDPVDIENNSYSIDAKQRIVISVKKNGNTIVCAEPSPDALASIAQAGSSETKI